MAAIDLIKQETLRQNSTIDLIASENVASPAVRAALGSVFTNKYAEGRPGARYYAGNSVVDELELMVERQVLELFVPSSLQADWRANVQPLSGSPANLAIYTALLQPGDTILSLSLSSGGHLSHGHQVTLPGKLYHIEQYTVDPTTEQIDYDSLQKQAEAVKPKLLIVGGSAYPRQLDFARAAEIAQSVGAYLLADVSHIAGLIVGGVHPSPIPHADVVMTTTHKTLRGPRGAVVMARAKLAEQINKGIFPGVQGGPHLNQLAALAVALEEAAAPEFKIYAKQVVDNAQALAAGLQQRGWRLVSGGTDTHLILADLSGLKLTGGEAQRRLEAAGIVANANAIPFDTRSPRDPSGIRFGTASVTTRGANQLWCTELADVIDTVVRSEKAINPKIIAVLLAKLVKVAP